MKSAVLIGLGVVLIAAGYAIVRRIQHKPLLPSQGDNIANDEREGFDPLAHTATEPTTSKEGAHSSSFLEDLGKRLSDAGKSISAELQKQAVPLGFGVGAAVSAAALAKAKGTPVRQPAVTKTPSGVTKAVAATQVKGSGVAVKPTAGVGPAKTPVTTVHVKPEALAKVTATVSKPGSTAAAAKIAGLVAKGAGRAIPIVGIGLTAYEIASIVNEKREHTTVGDLIEAGTGINTIAELLGQPAPIKGGAFDVKVLEVPGAIAKSLEASTAANKTGVAKLRAAEFARSRTSASVKSAAGNAVSQKPATNTAAAKPSVVGTNLFASWGAR